MSKRSGSNKHPAYGQWLFTLGFPMSDPIIELATVWAHHEEPTAKQMRMAIGSAERWMEAKDKRMRSAAKSVMNKLIGWLPAQEAAEDARQFRHAPRSLTSHRSNPGRRSKAIRKKPGKTHSGHVRACMQDITSGWDYDLVSAEDSINEYQEEHSVHFTAKEKRRMTSQAKAGSHMEANNPRRRRTATRRAKR